MKEKPHKNVPEKPRKNVPEKKPTILYIIILVLIVIILALIAMVIVLAVKRCKCNCTCNNTNSNTNSNSDCPPEKSEPQPYDTSHFIPVKQSFYTKTNDGSNALQGTLNHFDSPYFKMVDVYNMESNANRIIFSKFKTYQQTSEYSAQCAALIMALEYYGDTAPSERECMTFTGVTNVTDPDHFNETEEFYQKLNMKNFEEYIKSLGYNTTSNDDYSEDNFPYHDSIQFSSWVREILKKNETILVNWADWGGTCSVIIGVDNMGHESPEDHVLILADSYDTCDHLNDGYYIIGLDKFYYNWQSCKISYLNDSNEKYATGRFIIIHRKESESAKEETAKMETST